MSSKAPIGIFISYHRNEKDERLFEEMKKQLAGLANNHDITIWHTGEITGGEETENEINKHLKQARIILLLISPDFISNQPLEATRATELHSKQTASAIRRILVFPVLLRPVDWEGPPFIGLPPLPSDKTFINTSDEPQLDYALFNIAQEIKQEVKKLLSNQNYSSLEEGLSDQSREDQVTKLINEADRLLREEKSDAEAACQKYQEALNLDPYSVRAYISFGNALREQNNYEEAIKQYQRAIHLNPDNAEAHFSLSFVLCEQSKLEEALKELHETLRLNPKFSLAHLLLGLILLKQGKLEEARLKLKESANFAPGDDCLTQSLMKKMSDQDKAVLLAFWTIISDKGSELEEIIEKCSQAIDILKTQKRDFETNQLLASLHFWRGKAIQDQGKYEEAIVEYRQALRLDVDYVEAHYNLGAALSKQGNHKDAIVEYREVLRLSPGDADAHNKLGIALYKQSKFAEAIVEYRKAVYFKPNHANAYNNLGMALREQGKLEEAIKALNLAISLDPNNNIFRENLKDLKSDYYKKVGLLGRLFRR
jgi:tetratricopeptide (TPR) repeat protein